jgi:hypothetical protein
MALAASDLAQNNGRVMPCRQNALRRFSRSQRSRCCQRNILSMSGKPDRQSIKEDPGLGLILLFHKRTVMFGCVGQRNALLVVVRIPVISFRYITHQSIYAFHLLNITYVL